MTGVDFSNLLSLRIDKAYSGYLTNTEQNELAQEALIKVSQNIFKNLQTQNERDKLYSLIRTGQVFTPNASNQIYLNTSTSPNIPDYMDMFSVKAKFTEPIVVQASTNLTNSLPTTLLYVTNATNTSPIIVTVSTYNNLRTGDQLAINNINGNTAANGTFYVQQIGSFKVALYSDMNMQNPVSGNGTFANSPSSTIGRVFYKYCMRLQSSRKIDPYSTATVRVPRFEIADQVLKIYPNNLTCDEITCDYLKFPSVFVDVNDNSIDLLLTYPISLMYDVLDYTAKLFSEAFKDQELFNTSSNEAKNNEL